MKYLDGKQDDYQVHENIVLIQAGTPQEAFAEAKRLAKTEEVTITLSDGREAKWTYVGVRALVECQDVETNSLSQPENYHPTYGTEVTYIRLRVNNEEDLLKLVKGEAVNVELNERGYSEEQ